MPVIIKRKWSGMRAKRRTGIKKLFKKEKEKGGGEGEERGRSSAVVVVDKITRLSLSKYRSPCCYSHPVLT